MTTYDSVVVVVVGKDMALVARTLYGVPGLPAFTVTLLLVGNSSELPSPPSPIHVRSMIVVVVRCASLVWRCFPS
jgi:hypothetical protein